MDAGESRLVMAPSRAVERLIGDLRLSRKELADAVGATPRTLERWRAGGIYPQRDTRRRLAELIELCLFAERYAALGSDDPDVPLDEMRRRLYERLMGRLYGSGA